MVCILSKSSCSCSANVLPPSALTFCSVRTPTGIRPLIPFERSWLAGRVLIINPTSPSVRYTVIPRGCRHRKMGNVRRNHISKGVGPHRDSPTPGRGGHGEARGVGPSPTSSNNNNNNYTQPPPPLGLLSRSHHARVIWFVSQNVFAEQNLGFGRVLGPKGPTWPSQAPNLQDLCF